MTVTLDLPAHVVGRVEADAKAHNLSVADLLRDAVIDLYAAQRGINAGDETDPLTSDADALLVADALRAHQAGENKGKPIRDVAARLSAKYGFENPLS